MTLKSLPAWTALEAHYQEIRNTHLRDLFAAGDKASPKRAERFTISGAGLGFDFSKHRIDERTHEDKPRARAIIRRSRDRISSKAAAGPETPAPVPVNPAPASSDRRSPYERF